MWAIKYHTVLQWYSLTWMKVHTMQINLYTMKKYKNNLYIILKDSHWIPRVLFKKNAFELLSTHYKQQGSQYMAFYMLEWEDIGN